MTGSSSSFLPAPEVKMELESVGGSDGEGDRYSSIDEDSNTMSEGDEAILEDLYGTTR